MTMVLLQCSHISIAPRTCCPDIGTMELQCLTQAPTLMASSFETTMQSTCMFSFMIA